MDTKTPEVEVVRKSLEKLHVSAHYLARRSSEEINIVIADLADELLRDGDSIIAANRIDLAKMSTTDPRYDRLQITPERITEIAEGLRSLVGLPSPIGEVIEQRVLPNKLQVQRVRVPLGTLGMIYEARPNVTIDAFGIAFKTQNAIALKGGSDAHTTNESLVQMIHKVLKRHSFSPDIVYLLPMERSMVDVLLTANGLVDVIIPRGGQKLIEHVRAHATVPIIETGAGVVHTYFDAAGDVDMAAQIIFSEKTRRPSVCNALDTLLVHGSRLADLPRLVAMLAEKHVVIYGDKQSYEQLTSTYPKELLKVAGPEHFGKEFLDYAMSVKTVPDFDSALRFIMQFSSKHSESIITDDTEVAERFLKEVDAACVYHNAETGFSDGSELGLGAEIGISTQKLHARGPMGLTEMTSYKWIVRGEGQTRIKAD